jgi:Predicted outer membrane protein
MNERNNRKIMSRRRRQSIVIWCMTLLMAIYSLLPMGNVRAGNLDQSVLASLEAVIRQDGAVIPEGGTLASTKPVEVEISFGVPVEGDDPTPANPVRKGDTVTFELSDAFRLVSGNTIVLRQDSILVGHVHLSTDPSSGMVTATVIFDGEDEVFDGTYNSVECRFTAELEYDDSGAGAGGGNYPVSILQKTYVVNVPPQPIVYHVTKSGAADLAAQTVTWTVYAEAAQGGVPIDLGGYRIVDDLQQAGDYVDGSFAVDGTSAAPVVTGSTLYYEFTAGAMSGKTITYKTKIPDSRYYANGEQTLRNQVQLRNADDDTVGTAQAEVKFTPQWIEKSGETNDSPGGAIYNPKDRTITWTIIANHMEAQLQGVVIKDELPDGLNWKSAQWQAWTGSDWGHAHTIDPNDDGEYEIGEINTMILLTIVSEVPDDPYTTGVSTYTNSASLYWDDYPAPGIESGSIGVPIGYNAISKTGSANTSDRTIRWTVHVDTKGQTIPDLKVYDLLVYGNSINLGSVTGIPDDLNPNDLTARYGQKYAGNFNGTGTVTVTPIPIMQGGTQVADLLEITGFDFNHPNSFSFDSLVVDPNVFAGNQTSTVWNTAALFSMNAKLNAADASVNYTSHVLKKELLKREAIEDPAAGVNTHRTTNAQDGFDYQDKSVIFRLNVNSDGIHLTDAENAAGQKLGTATLTDKLPDGWEFDEIVPGSDYLIFEGTHDGNGIVLAADTEPDAVPGLNAVVSGDTATFEFDTLDKPYVILLKARPTAAEAERYFSKNQTVTKTNNVSIQTVNWEPGVTSSQIVAIESKILVKDYTKVEDGVLRWTVEYKPYLTAQPVDRLEDRLPLGLDLPLDANGKLLIAGNIEAFEMTLNANGGYTVGSPVALEQGANVFYDNAERVFTFVIPDHTKAYRFQYITYVTGNPGPISNQVHLLGGSEEQESTSDSYVVTSLDGSATLQKNGWIGIEKTDGSGIPLAGAEFALFAMDGVTIIKQGVTGTDGTVRLKVIPDGTYILRETAAPADYALEGVDHIVEVSTQGSTVTSSIDGRTGPDANILALKNYAAGTAGNLTISKTVDGAGADPSKTFDFTLTLNGAPGVYTYIGHGVPGGTIADGGTFSLAHGQSITIVGLPKDTAYTVTERDYADDGYTTTSTGASGIITADGTKTASFVNTRTVGSLMISKTVSGNGADPAKKFNFTVEFTGNGASKTYDYIGVGVPDGTIASGDTIAFAHGESITIVDLPEGLQYTVTEDDYSADGYVTVSTGETGVIVTDETQTAAFTNTRSVYTAPATGNLIISKTVTGDGADKARTFDFTVTFSGADGSYSYKGDGVPDGTIRSGDTVSLAHGQSITIEGLPAGAKYEVVEDAASSEGYIAESTGNSGTIRSFMDNVAAFVNVKRPAATGSLTIGKTVEGEGADLARKFAFTVTFDGADDVYPYTGSATGTIRSGDTISLAHGERITITGLPDGARYSVTEADYSAEGYAAASTGESGTIIGGAVQAASFTNILNLEPEEPGTPDAPELPEDPSRDAGASDGDSQQTGSSGDELVGVTDGSEEAGNQIGGAGALLDADSADPQSGVLTGGMPKTGDRSRSGLATLGLVSLSAVFAALLAADIALRRRGAGRRTGR